MRLSLRLSFFLVFGVAIVQLALSAYQSRNAQHRLRSDLERHALELAESLDQAAAPLIMNHSDRELQRLVNRFLDHGGLAGVAIYDAQNTLVAVSSKFASRLAVIPDAFMRAAQQGGGAGGFAVLAEEPMHVSALPIRSDAAIVGTLAVFHRTGYIAAQNVTIWRHAMATVALQALVVVFITWLVLRRGLGLPLAHLTRWLHDLRTGSASGGPELPDKAVFGPLTEEVARLAITLIVARAAAEEEARLREAAESM